MPVPHFTNRRRYRIAGGLASIALLLLAILSVGRESASAQQPQPTLKAYQSDQLVGDVNKNGRVDPGDTIRYTVIIANCGPVDAQNVVLNETLDTDTTFVAGSIKNLGQNNVSAANCAPAGATATTVPGATNTPVSGATATQTATPPPLTFTPSNTAVNTATNTASVTNTTAASATSTATATFVTNTPPALTLTPSNTASATNTATIVPSLTPTITNTATFTPSVVPTATNTATNTFTFTPLPTNTVTNTATFTPSLTNTATDTATTTPSLTNTATLTPSLTNTATFTPLPTNTATNTATFTPSLTHTATNTVTNTPTFTPLPTNTATDTATATPSLTNTASNTPTNTATFTPSNTPTNTSTPTPTPCPTSPDIYTAVGNILINVGAANGVFTNDACSSPITQVDGSPVSGVATIATGNGGTLRIDTTTGAFDYNPPVGYGTAAGQNDSFTYFRTGAASAVTVTITVYTPIWFIDDSAPGGGDGRFTDITGATNTAFNTITAFNGASVQAGDYVFIYSGSYGGTAGITMQSNLVVIGQASSLLTTLNNLGTYPPFANFNVLTLAPYTVASLATNTVAATSPVLGNTAGNTFTLGGTNNYIDSVTITQNTGTAIGGTGAGGTSYIRNANITASGSARVINLTTQSGTLTFTNGSLVAASTTNDAFTLTNNAATVNVNNPANFLVNGARGLVVNNAAFGGTLNITDGTSNIAVNNASPVDINNSGLGITLHDVNKSGSTQPTYGVSINNSTGTFTVTGTGATAASGGTIANIGTSGIRLANSTALTVNLRNMQLTNANNANVAASACTSGNNYTDCFGALDIRNLTGTSSVTTTQLNITTAVETGISMVSSRDVTITDSTINSVGTIGIYGHAMNGTVKINHGAGTSSITNFATVNVGRGIYFNGNSTNLTFSVTNTTITGTQTANQTGAIYVSYNGTSTGRVQIENNTLTNTGGGMVMVYLGEGTGSTATISNLQIRNNSLTQGAGGAEGIILVGNVTAGATQFQSFYIYNNTLNGMGGDSIRVINDSAGSSMNGVIEANTITNATSIGISVTGGGSASGGAGGNVHIKGNSVTTASASLFQGIRISGAGNTGASSRIDITVEGNTVNHTGGTLGGGSVGIRAIRVANTNSTLCTTYKTNNSFNVAVSEGTAIDYQFNGAAGGTGQLLLDGYTTGSFPTAYTTWLTSGAYNNIIAGATQGIAASGTIPTTAAGTCAAPPSPPPDFVASPQPVALTDRPQSIRYIVPAKDEAKYANVFATLPINIGAIPAGKAITITLDVVVNKPILKDFVSAQGTVTGSNFSPVLTDDPDTSNLNDPTLTPIDLSSVQLPATGERAWWRDLLPGLGIGVLVIASVLLGAAFLRRQKFLKVSR